MKKSEPLIIDPAKSWQRLRNSKASFQSELEQMEKELQREFLQQLMCHERQAYLRVQPYERSARRRDQCNGFYERHLTARHGVLKLAVPRTRSGEFRTRLLERYGRRAESVDQTLRQVFLLGVSTRQAGQVLSGLIEEKVSASTVSQVCKLLDENVRQWHQRPLSDKYEYLLLDGVSVRLRLAGRVKRRMVLCAYGMTRTGQRQLIDFLIAKSESEADWHRFLQELWQRGLHGTQLRLITVDGNAGLATAVTRVWPRSGLQRCWVHKLRNLESKLKRAQNQCLQEAKGIYAASHQKGALAAFRAWKKRWEKLAPKAVQCLEEDLEELLAFFACPQAHWKRVRTTNVIERTFVEVRRRIRTMCAFTTASSCERILYSVFQRLNDSWSRKPLKAFTHRS